MRLTIVNLVISGRRIRERERSAGILARKSQELNPPYAGYRDAAGAGYKVSGVTDARHPSPRRMPGPIRRELSFGHSGRYLVHTTSAAEYGPQRSRLCEKLVVWCNRESGFDSE